MLEFIQKIIIGLLTSLVNASNHTKCVFVTDQKYTLQPTSINVHPNEYTKGLRYYPFEVNLDRVVEVNTFTDLSIKVCVLNKIEDLNLNMLNMIVGIN